MKHVTRLSFLAASLGSLATLAGCAHHRDVRPGDDGIHRIVLQAESKEGRYRDAMSEAEDYCKTEDRAPIIVSEGTKFTGDMDESTYTNGKRVSKVAEMAGGAVWAMGGKNESNAGGIVGMGGGVADAALGTGYTYEMKFKCR